MRRSGRKKSWERNDDVRGAGSSPRLSRLAVTDRAPAPSPFFSFPTTF